MSAAPQERHHGVRAANRKTRPSIILGTSVLTFGLLGAGLPGASATPIASLVNTPVEDAHRNGVGIAEVADQFSSAPTPSQELHWPQTRPDGATQSGVVVQRAGQGESPSKNSQDLSPWRSQHVTRGHHEPSHGSETFPESLPRYRLHVDPRATRGRDSDRDLRRLG